MDCIIGLRDEPFFRGDRIRHLISGKVDTIFDFENEENVITTENKIWHVCNIEHLKTGMP